MVGVPSVRRSADLRVSAVLIWSEIHFFVCESHRRHPWGSFFSYCRLLPPREIAKFVLAHGLVGRGGGGRTRPPNYKVPWNDGVAAAHQIQLLILLTESSIGCYFSPAAVAKLQLTPSP